MTKFRKPPSPPAPAAQGEAPEGAKSAVALLKHPLLGSLKGTITVATGVDLTEPADPDWGKVYDE